MDKEKLFAQIKGGLIVSCQAKIGRASCRERV